MKTLFKQPFPMLVVTIVTTTLAACSSEMNPTEASAGETQAVAVNFTTPSIGSAAVESPWQENDQVTVIPQATPEAAITFGYTKQADESYAWQNILEGGDNYFKAFLPASFTAYCPTTEGISINAFTLPNISDYEQTGQANQSDAEKFRAADYMTTPVTTVARVGQVLDLTLAHRLCRLTFVVTEYGNEFNGVTPTLTEVKIKSQNRTVDLTYQSDQVEVAATGNPVWISPLAATNGSNQPTYTAIVTPCTLISGDMELMSLTVNGIPLRVKHKGNLADLASGNAYTFHLKVGKDYVTVTAGGATEWTSIGGPIVVGSKEIKQGFAATDLKVCDYYYSDGTWSDGGYREYTDGATTRLPIMPVLTDASRNPRTIIGIVYWVGDATSKDKTLKKYHSGCTHGLVVAVSGDESVAWQSSDKSVQEWLNINKTGEFLSVHTLGNANAPLNNIQGYNNTKAIEEFNADPANSNNIVPAVQKAVEYREKVHAPSSSSDWYLPSAKELTLLCGKNVDDIGNNKTIIGTANRDLINGQLRQLSSIAGATELSTLSHWSSSELYDSRAFYVSFTDGHVNQRERNYSGNKVRFSLAF